MDTALAAKTSSYNAFYDDRATYINLLNLTRAEQLHLTMLSGYIHTKSSTLDFIHTIHHDIHEYGGRISLFAMFGAGAPKKYDGWSVYDVNKIPEKFVSWGNPDGQYISLNRFFNFDRQSSSCRTITGWYIDIDFHEDPSRKDAALAVLDKMLLRGVLPMPTAVTDSGRGFAFFYILDKSIAVTRNTEKQRKRYQYIYQGLQKKFSDVLTEAGFPDAVDTKVSDLSRVFRLPMSWNIAADKPCSILSLSKKYYTFKDLEDVLGNTKAGIIPHTDFTKAAMKKQAVPKTYTGAQTAIFLDARIKNLEAFLSMKGASIVGCREVFLMIYYWTCAARYGYKTACEMTEKLYRENQYLSGIRASEVKHIVSQRDNKGKPWRFTNETILRMLNLKEGSREAELFSAAGDQRELQRTEIRAKKQSRKENIIYMVATTELTYAEIAGKYGVSENTVYRYAKAAGVNRTGGEYAETPVHPNPVIVPMPKNVCAPVIKNATRSVVGGPIQQPSALNETAPTTPDTTAANPDTAESNVQTIPEGTQNTSYTKGGTNILPIRSTVSDSTSINHANTENNLADTNTPKYLTFLELAEKELNERIEQRKAARLAETQPNANTDASSVTDMQQYIPTMPQYLDNIEYECQRYEQEQAERNYNRDLSAQIKADEHAQQMQNVISIRSGDQYIVYRRKKASETRRQNEAVFQKLMEADYPEYTVGDFLKKHLSAFHSRNEMKELDRIHWDYFSKGLRVLRKAVIQDEDLLTFDIDGIGFMSEEAKHRPVKWLKTLTRMLLPDMNKDTRFNREAIPSDISKESYQLVKTMFGYIRRASIIYKYDKATIKLQCKLADRDTIVNLMRAIDKVQPRQAFGFAMAYISRHVHVTIQN
jgi:transposase-like protein